MIKVIEFDKISKVFKNKQLVLNETSFDFMSGTNYFLFGESSSGKTAIFKLLLKDIKPTSGIVRICGDNLAKFNKKQILTYRRELGIIWQETILLENKTIFENIALPLVLRGQKEDVISQKGNEILKEADLFTLKYAFPDDLTLGQKRIVEILRAIITKPKIIIADEPFNHIDSNKKNLLWDLINKHKDPNATCLFMTSQKYMLEHFAATVLNLKSGRFELC